MNSAVTTLSTLSGALIGAAAMYYMDPTTGRRRRALVRDRAVALSHDAGHLAKAQGRRAADHLRGVAARSRSMLSHTPVSDDTLRERVRARLGRVASRPKEIEVEVEQGCVCLRGRVAPAEVDPLLDEVSALTGVERVENQLVADETLRETAMQRDRRRRSGMRIATPLLALLALASVAGIYRVAAPRRHRPFALFS